MRSPKFFILSILLAIYSSAALADKRVALVIGNSSYKNVSQLANPANDAAAVGSLFLRAGFDVVETKRDLTNTEMRRTLRDFSARSRDADLAVVYYAGHGIEVEGMNYLVPIDATLEQDSDAYDEAVALDRVLQSIEPAKRLRLVILDACRDNPFARTMKRTVASRSLGRGLAGVEPGKPNTLIAFAAKGGSTADDGAGSNSPFTTALLKHLTTPGLDLRQAFGLIRDDVMKATNDKQEPFVYGSLGGATVTLVPNVPAQSTASSQPAANPQVEVRKDYELALQLNNRQAWEFFVQQYPSGFYTNLARVQIEKIGAEEAQRAAAEKAKQAEAEKVRLAAEGAKAAEQAKAERDAKAAEKARIAAELHQKGEQAKAEAAERARVTAEQTAADRESERLKLAALDQSKTANTIEPAQQNVIRSLQAELQRVGCYTGAVNDDWKPSSRRALDLFNKHAGLKLETKVASLDALDAVKSKQSRICPLACEFGFRARGDVCEKIVCRKGYVVGDDNVCEKAEPRKPIAIRPLRDENAKTANKQGNQASGQQQIICNPGSTCRPIAKGCRIVGSFGGAMSVAREVCD